MLLYHCLGVLTVTWLFCLFICFVDGSTCKKRPPESSSHTTYVRSRLRYRRMRGISSDRAAFLSGETENEVEEIETVEVRRAMMREDLGESQMATAKIALKKTMSFILCLETKFESQT